MPELFKHKMLKPCSELSQLLEEDPIGTAPIWDKCIVIELPSPWSAKIEESKNFDKSITCLFYGFIFKAQKWI